MTGTNIFITSIFGGFTPVGKRELPGYPKGLEGLIVGYSGSPISVYIL
jgi:hypothetical protein